MIKRLSTAAIGCAFVCSIGSVQARPYFGFDGRHYGEVENAPNFGRQKVEHGKLDHADAPRKCLKPEIHALLEKVEDLFGPVEVISTCRPGATIAGTGRPSRHASGNAVDFEAGSKKAQILNWLVANNPTGGTMTYSDMSHIHIDYGPHFVSLAPSSRGGITPVASRSVTSGVSVGTRTASRGSVGSARYAEGYSRDYDGGSRRYAGGGSGYSYASDRAYGSSHGGSEYRNGYATIYRQ